MKLQVQLDEWRKGIDKPKAKADKAEADIQFEYYKQIDEMRSIQEAATGKLTELNETRFDA